MKKQKDQSKQPLQMRRKAIFHAVFALILLSAIFLAIFPMIQMLSTEEGQMIVAEKMRSFGIFLPLIFVFLQVLQIVVAVIPGGPMPLIGEILFGKTGTLALCLAGFFLGTVLVYYLVQWIGRPLVDKFVKEEYFQKFEFLMKSKRLEWLLLLVFLLPGLPKDVLTYLVSFGSKIKPIRLFLLTTIGRTPATILTIFMGDSIWDGDYRIALIMAVLLFGLTVGGFFIKRYIDRRAKKTERKKENLYGKSEHE